MNLLFVAGILAVLIGIVHSVLGEILIFQRLRRSGVIPTNGGDILTHWHIRIVWACWHVMTLFGFAIAAFLLHVGQSHTRSIGEEYTLDVIAIVMALSAALILIAMKGRHPAWLVLLAISVLVWFA